MPSTPTNTQPAKEIREHATAVLQNQPSKARGLSQMPDTGARHSEGWRGGLCSEGRTPKNPSDNTRNTLWFCTRPGTQLALGLAEANHAPVTAAGARSHAGMGGLWAFQHRARPERAGEGTWGERPHRPGTTCQIPRNSAATAAVIPAGPRHGRISSL